METKPHQCMVCCDGKFLQYTLIINRITLDITEQNLVTKSKTHHF